MNEESPIDIYCREQGYKKAKQIDDATWFVVKPKPWWCPNWLYKAVLKETVEIVKTPESL